jgi:hypothetical protein
MNVSPLPAKSSSSSTTSPLQLIDSTSGSSSLTRRSSSHSTPIAKKPSSPRSEKVDLKPISNVQLPTPMQTLQSFGIAFVFTFGYLLFMFFYFYPFILRRLLTLSWTIVGRVLSIPYWIVDWIYLETAQILNCQ